MMRLALVLALGACPSPTRPTLVPGQVITLDDGVLRTRADQTIELSVHRVFADQEADGTIILKDLTVDEARRSPVGRVARGRAWISLVRAISEPSQAYLAAVRGLDDLGTEYMNVKKPIFDDTGMQVKLAKIAAEEQGDYPTAVRYLQHVLESRDHAYLVTFRQNVH